MEYNLTRESWNILSKIKKKEIDIRKCETCRYKATPYYMIPCARCRSEEEWHTNWEKR